MADDEMPAGLMLERFIADKFAAMSLCVPSDDVEMMARFVEEDGIEREDKVEGVRGMLEGVVETMPSEDAINPAIDAIIDEQSRLAVIEAEAEARAAAEEEKEEEENSKPGVEAVLASLTEEELAEARKAALLRQYAYVEGGPEEERSEGPPRGASKEEAEAKKAAEERRKLVEEALRLDSRKKKYRKQQTIDDPLEWNNLNREKVQAVAALQRTAHADTAKQRKDRDKAALDKQRADQAKAKADRQKKAQKQERRG
ncbi:hypothetical protein CcaverHIS002_0603990 [Cutaneotrichosporon cavernicola]|uniref:Coiled-coil domain-containing protein 43 n=1 Tax=Cutaneotrichosporon cavernicola TaxID=279322 RepID=A0AA48QY13_9TREE|nr:uncharacterized protein CcaverHIS019_0603440 [Cutaneotrichosporon cavernicola]BEI86112.1 hypothetical protein CcaverHIS002_0603990 [Cutaneotrichosporon cavernicola]BEI93885.1 hypothetical protein CcaverHIS019_0603440 [Cutaneotrichosporon cavernicola]BEJ01663.1 hypothetical protein CcaverHIS631_0603450 [Cutaneotrichosporon cavernicola]BEJ09431.1 hypothetical protein CcaverHIS641_0603460 [Cutaneotrichosporon cavernicola]